MTETAHKAEHANKCGDTGERCYVWKKIATAAKEGRAILIYGTGNGADKLIDILCGLNISISAVFASDGFVRDRSFRGFKVMSASNAYATYPDSVTLVAFGSSLPDVMEHIFELAEEHELYIPDLPLAGFSGMQSCFTLDFYEYNKAEFDFARGLFSDGESKRVFDAVIDSKLTGDVRSLRSCVSPDVQNEVWHEILAPKRYRSFVDAGAYRGDTLREMIELRRGAVGADGFLLPADFDFYAFEPDKKNFARLSALCLPQEKNEITTETVDGTEFSEINNLCENSAQNTDLHTENTHNFRLINAAVWSRSGSADFTAGGNRNSNISNDNAANSAAGKSGAKNIRAALVSVDEILQSERKPTSVDYIKYDVEGAEYEALLGSKATIAAFSPDLCVSAYHRIDDLFKLPALIHELNPSYRLFLRKLPSIPAWDINIYAVDEK